MQDVEQQNNNMASRGLRVLGLAMKQIPSSETQKLSNADQVEKDLVFLGLFGIIDPPREEVKEAVRNCKTAGIRVCMITGLTPCVILMYGLPAPKGIMLLLQLQLL